MKILEKIRLLFHRARIEKEYTLFWILTIATKLIILALFVYFLYRMGMVFG